MKSVNVSRSQRIRITRWEAVSLDCQHIQASTNPQIVGLKLTTISDVIIIMTMFFSGELWKPLHENE